MAAVSSLVLKQPLPGQLLTLNCPKGSLGSRWQPLSRYGGIVKDVRTRLDIRASSTTAGGPLEGDKASSGGLRLPQLPGWWGGKTSPGPSGETPPAGGADTGQAGEGSKVGEFIRFVERGADGAELQTAVVTYRREKKRRWQALRSDELEVDLVACVHLADKEYFTGMQVDFEKYDRVLYEMVAEKGSQPPAGLPADKKAKPLKRSSTKPAEEEDTSAGGGPLLLARARGAATATSCTRDEEEGTVKKRRAGFSGRASKRRWRWLPRFSVVGAIQRLMARVLSLEFQLECMDYERANWQNADLDLDTFKKLQSERGESLWSFARTLSSSTSIVWAPPDTSGLQPWQAQLLSLTRFVPMPLVGLFVIGGVCQPEDAPLAGAPEVRALLNLDVATALKLTLARQLAADISARFDSNNLITRSVIIGERNSAAMEGLRDAIDDGCKTIAVFYGTAHLPDIEKRLKEEFGLTRVGLRWNTAWRMRKRDGGLTLGSEDSVFEAGLAQMRKTLNWPLNRYQTVALLIFSVALAADLWFWEVMLGVLNSQVEEWLPAIGGGLGWH